MIPITAIIPVRLDCPERLDNLWTVTSYLLDQLQVAEVVVIEADIRPRILGCIDHPRIRWQYVQVSPTWAWNKGRVVNAGLPFVNTRFMTVWDVDGLLSKQAVLRSIDLLASDGAEYVVPWSKCLYLKRDAPLRDVVRAGGWAEPDPLQASAETVTATGLVGVSTTQFFRHIRGFSELFHGWGGEDSELLARITKLGKRVVRLETTAAHLYHPSSSQIHPEFHAGSQGELDRVAGMTAEQLQTYFGLTDKPGRYTALRRPDPLVKPAAVPPTATA